MLVLSACSSSKLVDEVTPTTYTLAPTATLDKANVPFEPDVELTLRAIHDEASIVDGQPTQIARYVGEVHKGSAAVLQPIVDSYLGPTIHLNRGQNVRITLQNELMQSTIIHWHGQHLPEDMDGHPRYVIEPQESYVYEFTVNNRAGTYWYHPHPHQRTGGQTYFGLAGMFIIHDDEEAAFDMPQGAYDLPLVIQDRTFNADNQLVYVNNMHQIMQGYFGDTVLVNGRPNYTQSVATRAYRLRLLNGSNARTYKLGRSKDTCKK